MIKSLALVAALTLPLTVNATQCDGTRLADYMTNMLQEGNACVNFMQRFGADRMWNGEPGDACYDMRDYLTRADRESKRLKAAGCTSLSHYPAELPRRAKQLSKDLQNVIN